MNIYEKLAEIQHELKCNKGQYNSFGGYKYRSCEDILEAAKPLCYKYKTTLVLSDELLNIGDRYYVKATAKLIDCENNEVPNNIVDLAKMKTSIENTAYAREADQKKGMDESQITGTASSYARKYALNGLFNIDDTKDADTDEFAKITAEDVGDKKIDKIKLKTIQDLAIEPTKAKEVLAEYGYDKSTDIKVKDYAVIFKRLKELSE